MNAGSGSHREHQREFTLPVQRTSRRNRSLKDDDIVLAKLEDAGTDRKRVITVDSSKIDEVLEVTTLTESDLYEIDESQYVRKADVDEEVKESRLQGLKDQLAAAESPETDELQREIKDLEARVDELQREIKDLEARVDELTSFSSASEVD